jgi:hypothetical protein
MYLIFNLAYFDRLGEMKHTFKKEQIKGDINMALHFEMKHTWLFFCRQQFSDETLLMVRIHHISHELKHQIVN